MFVVEAGNELGRRLGLDKKDTDAIGCLRPVFVEAERRGDDPTDHQQQACPIGKVGDDLSGLVRRHVGRHQVAVEKITLLAAFMQRANVASPLCKYLTASRRKE